MRKHGLLSNARVRFYERRGYSRNRFQGGVLSDDAREGKWLKVKASMPRNQKVSAVSDSAFRLHMTVSCWCCDELTDGMFKAHVPATVPRAPQGTKLTDAIRELVDAGLWIPTTEGYRINDFLDYNMSRTQWEAKKAAGRLGGKLSGEKRRSKNEAPASAPVQAKPKQVLNQNANQNEAPPQHDNEYDLGSSKSAGSVSDLQARARKVLENPHDGQWQRPSQWPEVQSVAAAWSVPFGIKNVKLRDYAEGDSDLKAILSAIADGYSVEELCSAGEKAKGSSYFSKQENPGPASFTAAVLRRLLRDGSASRGVMVWES